MLSESSVGGSGPIFFFTVFVLGFYREKAPEETYACLWRFVSASSSTSMEQRGLQIEGMWSIYFPKYGCLSHPSVG